MNKRPTRTVRSTRTKSDQEDVQPRPRRRTRPVRQKTARQAEVPEAVVETTSPARKRRVKKETAGYQLKPSDIARRSKGKKPPASTQTIILAMSPGAANILRAILGRARHDVPELIAIQNELEDQLK